MTNDVYTPPPEPAGIAAVQAASPSTMDRVDGGLEGLWHLLTSMRVAMVIMLCIAVLGIAGSLIIQAPSGVMSDPSSKATWIDGVRPRFGGWTGLLDTLQLFDVFNSVAFRVLVAALTISLVACSVHRIPGMVRTASKPRVDVGPAFFQHAPQHEAIVVRHTPEETKAIVTGVFRKHGYRALLVEDEQIHIYGDRWRWMQFAGLAGHLSLVVILAGAIIGGMWGYRDSDFSVAEGSTLAVAPVPGLSLKLIDFTATYDTVTGAPSDYASTVVLLKDGNQIDSHVIRVNDPLHYEGLTFYQASFGSAAVLTVKDSKGATLASEGIPFSWSVGTDQRPLGIYPLPGTTDTLWVIGTSGDSDTQVKPGQVEVQVWGSSATAPIDDKVINQGVATTIAGMSMTFDRESQFTRLNVARDPGAPLVWGGSCLLFFGFVLRFVLPHKRIWGRIVARPNGGAVVGMATLTQKDAALGTDFEDLVNDIRTALQAPVQA